MKTLALTVLLSCCAFNLSLGQSPSISSPRFKLIYEHYTIAHHLQYDVGEFEAAAAHYDSAAALLSSLPAAGLPPSAQGLLVQITSDLYDEWMSAWISAASHNLVRQDVALTAALAIAERGRALAFAWVDTLSRSTTPEVAGMALPLEGLQLISRFRERNASCVFYLIHGDSLRVIGFGPTGKIFSVERQSPNAGVLDGLRSLTFSLNDTTQREMTAYLRNHPETLEMYLKLLTPLVLPDSILNVIEPGREVVIVPDGWVNFVPFPGLLDPRNGRRLVSEVPLRIVPSLKFDLKARRDRNHPLPRSGRYVFADPVGDLPGARAEGVAVAKALGCRARVGSAASETALRGVWASATIMHLATHARAFLGAAAPESYVRLARDSTNDGKLTAREIEELPRTKAEIIVLSACQTGLGDLVKHEGILGVEWAMLISGTRSCLSTLWAVDDSATSHLMVAFYKHWGFDKDKPSKAESLRRAQSEIAKRPGWSDPIYWAGFRLVGDETQPTVGASQSRVAGGDLR